MYRASEDQDTAGKMLAVQGLRGDHDDGRGPLSACHHGSACEIGRTAIRPMLMAPFGFVRLSPHGGDGVQ